MNLLCPQCRRLFQTPWGLSIHLRTCTTPVVGRSGPGIPRTANEGIASRRLLRGFPLPLDWDHDAGGGSEHLEALVGRHIDNIIVSDADQYWGRLEQVDEQADEQADAAAVGALSRDTEDGVQAVSYTHLTLPTKA